VRDCFCARVTFGCVIVIRRRLAVGCRAVCLSVCFAVHDGYCAQAVRVDQQLCDDFCDCYARNREQAAVGERRGRLAVIARVNLSRTQCFDGRFAEHNGVLDGGCDDERHPVTFSSFKLRVNVALALAFGVVVRRRVGELARISIAEHIG